MQGNGPQRRTSNGDTRVYMNSISSEDILDENSQSQKDFLKKNRQGPMRKKFLIILVVVLVAVAGAIVAFIVTKGDSKTNASTSSGGSDGKSGTSTSGGSSKTSGGTSGGSSTTKKADKTKTLTDPTKDKYPVTAYAIGDWGKTPGKNGSCCSRRKGKYNGFDWNAEQGVAKLMDTEAKTLKPACVLGHGDSFYWTGIQGPKDQQHRFEETFEQRHKVASMADVPWINVMGNHDYGGGSYICVDDNEELAACKSGSDLVANLKKRFTLQSTYKSPNNDRWKLTDHFYKYTLTQGDVSVDVFNLDMNDAESHGANEICCQCYSYAEGNDTVCKGATRGGKYCCNGDTAMYDACVGQFKEWGSEAMTKLVDGVKQSTATWKIVNSHYSPYGHYGETSGKKWMDTLNGLGVQLWIAGHTHGEKHDMGNGMHFIENGAGGGIQSESASGIPPWATGLSNLWTAGGLGNDGGNTYGFFTLQASTSWLKVRYITFDDNWNLAKSGSGLTGQTGGNAEKWCYYIPVDGSEGQKC